MRSTEAVINVACIRRNVARVKELVNGTKLTVMVKADGYGHGLVQSARAAVEGGADALGVATVEEAMALREAGVTAEIISVGAVLDKEEVENAVKCDLEQTVFRPETVELLANAARATGKTAKIHIKTETGMHRLGVKLEDLDALLDAVDNTHGLVEVVGAFTHFAESDSADKAYTYEQNSVFAECAAKIKAKHPHALLHTSCSGAILSCDDLRYDMVRAGIIAYGYLPSDEVSSPIKLEPAFTLKTAITNLHTVQAGESVSYGRTFVADRATAVATIPIGYGDGYRRALSNTGYVLVNGKRAPIIGRVCMDQTMVDVTDCGDVSVGDEVVLIGEQGGDAIYADELAQWCGTICYEIMLGITPRVRRRYIDN